MQDELMLNIKTCKIKEEDYDSLKEAIIELSSASEEQFESIKAEKWYNRVFDMITFSQKGKKRLAEQIGTVAQAQHILVELLLRLSLNNTNISSLVKEQMVYIKRIQEQNIYMLERIMKLENISLGIKPSMDIGLLSKKNKQILSGCLYHISEQNPLSSEEQKYYANKVIGYIDIDVQMDNPLIGIASLDSDSRKKILACCMEYMFLLDYKIEDIDRYSDFIDEFDFGRKTINEISTQIQAIHSLRGVEGFFQKYQMENFEEIEEVFFIEFQEDIEIEDYKIDKSITIEVGKELIISNKNLYIDDTIFVYGHLIIENSNIFIDKKDLMAINGFSGSQVDLKNCTFNMEFAISTPIMNFNSSSVSFNQCRFVNFAIDTKDSLEYREQSIFELVEIFDPIKSRIGIINIKDSELNFKDCFFLSGKNSFLSYDPLSSIVFDSSIIENHIGNFAVQQKFMNDYNDKNIDLNLNEKELIIRDCSFINMKLTEEYVYNFHRFGSKSINILDCSFERCNICLVKGRGNLKLSNIEIKESKLKKFSGEDYLINWGGLIHIVDSIFDSIDAEIKSNYGKVIIENVRFQNIIGTIIDGRNSKVEISKCQFLKCKNFQTSALVKIISEDENYVSKIDSSLFKDCDVNWGVLINSKGYIYEEGKSLLNAIPKKVTIPRILARPLARPLAYGLYNDKVKKAFTSLIVKDCSFINCKYKDIFDGIQDYGKGKMNCIKSVNNTIID